MKVQPVVRDQPAYTVPPVARAFKLLRHIASGDTVTNMSVTARQLDISRTTLIRLIATLESEQMIEKISDGNGYRLGMGLAGLAGQALVASDIVQVGEPIIRDLSDHLGLSSHIGVLSGREVLYVARRTPNVHLVSNVSVGSRLPAHATTLGRIILAHTPPNTVRTLFHGVRLKPATDKTPTTLASLLKQIETDGRLGIAWSDANFETGISSAAVAIFGRDGDVVGAVNVTGPSANFDTGANRRRDIELAVRDAANRASRRLGFVASEPAGLVAMPPQAMSARNTKGRT
jgi:DNA-binding IclR family transcriptional regulator